MAIIEPHVPPPNKRGRPMAHAARQILVASFYVLKSGCPWRMVPHEFSSWRNSLLLVLGGGVSTGRGRSECGAARAFAGTAGEAHPSVGHSGLPVGQDHRGGRGATARIRRGAKKVRGSKRHLLLVDTQGLVLEAKVHSAKVSDESALRNSSNISACRCCINVTFTSGFSLGALRVS